MVQISRLRIFVSLLFTLASSNEAKIYFIEIYFDTSTFDKVEQDKKINLVLSLRIRL